MQHVHKTIKLPQFAKAEKQGKGQQPKVSMTLKKNTIILEQLLTQCIRILKMINLSSG